MAPNGSTWTVDAQREDFRPGPTGQFAQGVVITFTTGRGQQGSVFVPDSEYTTERVRQLVGQRAAQMDEISTLTGS